MTLKERIIEDFLKDDRKNFSIYGTNKNELSQMYDKLISSIKSGEKFERFLNFENALTSDGRIKFDMVTDFERSNEAGKKENFKQVKVVFKYAVYNYINTEYRNAIANIKEKDAKIPLPV